MKQNNVVSGSLLEIKTYLPELLKKWYVENRNEEFTYVRAKKACEGIVAEGGDMEVCMKVLRHQVNSIDSEIKCAMRAWEESASEELARGRDITTSKWGALSSVDVVSDVIEEGGVTGGDLIQLANLGRDDAVEFLSELIESSLNRK